MEKPFSELVQVAVRDATPGETWPDRKTAETVTARRAFAGEGADQSAPFCTFHSAFLYE